MPSLCVGQGFLEMGNLAIGSWTKEPLFEAAIEILKENIEKIRNSSTEFDFNVLGKKKIISPDVAVFYPVGTELVMDCLPGYRMEGEPTNTCENTNRWSHPFPACSQIICPNLANIDNGQLVTEGFKFRQRATYKCDPGFSLAGSSLRTCLDTGDWSGDTPTCAPLICPEPEEVEHGVLAPLASVEYGALASYSCLPGHTLLGGAERVCGHQGSWSGQLPLCVNTSQNCLVPQLINSGYVAYDGNLEVGSQAWYDCNAEHELVGPRERTCQEDGGWSGASPSCRPEHCVPVRELVQGSVVGLDFGFESSLQFSCNPGYGLQGADIITCGKGQLWSNHPPVCVPLTCPSPDPIDKGQIRGSARRFGDSITYSCSAGHTLLGPRVRRCTSDSLWSGRSPRCAVITCPQPAPLENGRVELELPMPGEKARFHCNLGWALQGNTNITCTSSGQWEGDVARCVPAQCTIPSKTTAILVSQQANEAEVGAKITWACAEGLLLHGSNTLTCLPTGIWDIDPPSCVKPDCSAVVEVDNGVIFGLKNTSLGTEVRFSCDNGYYKVSSSELSCSLGGRWEGSIPICSRHQCPQMSAVAHATSMVRPLGDTYVMDYQCEEQYKLVGGSKLTCLSGDMWDSKPPSCILSYCLRIPNIPKMLYKRGQVLLGETVKFTCQHGHQIKGATFIKCLQSGTWATALPSCLPLTCSFERHVRHGSWKLSPGLFTRQLWAEGKRLEQPNNAIYVGDSLRVVCDRGYEVFREAESQCLVTQQLDYPVAKCKTSHCSRLRNIEYGSLKTEARYKGATASYSCQEGHRIKGNNKRRCLRNKTWSGSPPSCQVVTCPIVHDIAHGEVELDNGAAEYGAVLRYSCHLGYELVGVASRRCGPQGQWEGAEPECVLVRCPAPRIPLHGEQEVQSLAAGGTVAYSCTHGYRLAGSHLLTCLADKTWSHPLPSCHRIYCKQPKTPSNGKVVAPSWEYQAHAQYSCFSGHSLVGPHSRSCLHTGQWSGPEPSCRANLCPKVTVKQGTASTEGLNPGDAATMACNPGFRLQGASRLVCQMSLEWAPAPPSCLPVHCGEPHPVENAIAVVEDKDYMSTLDYRCLQGFEARGSTQLTCSGDGTWEGDLPSCVPTPCTYLETPPHTTISFSSPHGYDLGFGSTASLLCLPGYVAMAASTVTCGQDGQWRGEVHPCLPVPCGSPPLASHSSVQVTLKDGHYHADFSCSPGYFLKGASRLLCASDTTWQFGM